MPCPLIPNADVIRVTRIDGCGRPVCGPNNAFTFDCFASLNMEADIEEGEPIQFKAANGRICGGKQACPSFRGFNIELNFFAASPELVEIMTGSPVVFGYDGKPIGFDTCSLACRTGFALELWGDVLGEDVCPEEDTGEGSWVYFLLPWVTNGIIGDLELGGGEDGVTFTLTGHTRAGGRWGVGPWDVVAQDAAGTPGPMLTPLDSACHRRMMITSVAPPKPECAYQPVEGELCESS